MVVVGQAANNGRSCQYTLMIVVGQATNNGAGK